MTRTVGSTPMGIVVGGADTSPAPEAAPAEPMASPPMCQPMIQDLWDEVQVHALVPGDIICVLGRELKVEYCVPAERGGDFYILEAYGPHLSEDIEMRDVVSFTLDKNTPIHTRNPLT